MLHQFAFARSALASLVVAVAVVGAGTLPASAQDAMLPGGVQGL